MKRCIDCRWYTLPVTAGRCHTCKQINPHKTQDNWEPPVSQVGGVTAPPKPIPAPPVPIDFQDIILDYLNTAGTMPDRIAKMLKLQELDNLEEETSSINPMIVIEAKLK